MMKRFFLLALAAVACSPSITLTTDRATYRPGEDVTLTLKNSSLAPLSYNLCWTKLFPADGGTISDTDGGFCQANLLQLNGGMSVTSVRNLPASLGAGAYHYGTDVEFDDKRVDIVSNEFDVAP